MPYSDKISILLVEDEAILAMEMSETLEMEGYNVVDTASNGRRALEIFQHEPIDLLICDINIKGDWDGIETVQHIIAVRPVPVIYLTALADKDTIERAKHTFPAAYIPKPYNLTSLRISIEMALNNFALRSSATTLPVLESDGDGSKSYSEDRESPSRDSILKVDDHIFVKNNYRFVKITLGDILYMEADNNHTVIQTNDQKLAIRQSLSAILERLAVPHLIRTHRSYAVNLDRVDSFNDYEIRVGKHDVPLGRNYKEAFLRYFDFR
jgi:two-component system, response regulator PdtaR